MKTVRGKTWCIMGDILCITMALTDPDGEVFWSTGN